MIALSNGSRMSELLQVSWNKERRVTQAETVAVLGEDGQAFDQTSQTPFSVSVPQNQKKRDNCFH